MNNLELYHNDMSTCAQKVRMVLAEKSIKWKGHHLDLRAGDQFKPKFRKLNPKSVIPVIIHNLKTITESNVIIEYLDEAFPTVPLMPEGLHERAEVRKWLLQLDAGLHKDIAIISFCITFRSQVLQSNNTPEAMEEFYNKIPDKSRATLMRDMIDNGLNSRNFTPALFAYKKLINDMDAVLSKHKFLVGDQITLADYAYVPYITRLNQLQLQGLWQNAKHLSSWYECIKMTNSYQTGLIEWNNPKYIDFMESTGKIAWPKVESILN